MPPPYLKAMDTTTAHLVVTARVAKGHSSSVLVVCPQAPRGRCEAKRSPCRGPERSLLRLEEPKSLMKSWGWLNNTAPLGHFGIFFLHLNWCTLVMSTVWVIRRAKWAPTWNFRIWSNSYCKASVLHIFRFSNTFCLYHLLCIRLAHLENKHKNSSPDMPWKLYTINEYIQTWA